MCFVLVKRWFFLHLIFCERYGIPWNSLLMMPHHEGIHATGCASPKTCIVNVDLFPEKMNLLLDWISRQALLDPVFQDPYPHSIRIPLEWFPSANQTWPVRNIIHVQQPFMDDCPTKRSHSPVRCSITRGLYNVIYILLQHQFYWAPKSALTVQAKSNMCYHPTWIVAAKRRGRI